jgi:hypothetical protein
MPNTTEWISWDDNKWHLESDNPSRVETICGELIPMAEDAPFVSHIKRLSSDTIPTEDDGKVCLHCVRWAILKLRGN